MRFTGRLEFKTSEIREDWKFNTSEIMEDWEFNTREIRGRLEV